MTAYRVGAVAYHPRVVTIWEAFRVWFAERDFPAEHTLYSTYERQVDALFAGEIDVAWNTNLAYVRTRLRAGGACSAIAMRDTDRGWTSHIVARDPGLVDLDALRGARIGFGDIDSPQAFILPAYWLRREGFDPSSDARMDQLNRDVGKHGDTGGAEVEQFQRMLAGDLDACIVSEPTLAAMTAEGTAGGDVRIAWTSPPFHHCNFTALTSSGADHERFRELLLEMDASQPELCDPMRLEYVNRWVDGDESGYTDLIAAVGASA